MRLAVILAMTLIAGGQSVIGITYAHEDPGCSVESGHPEPARYMLYVSSSVDHVVARAVSGVTGVSVSRSSNTF